MTPWSDQGQGVLSEDRTHPRPAGRPSAWRGAPLHKRPCTPVAPGRGPGSEGPAPLGSADALLELGLLSAKAQ